MRAQTPAPPTTPLAQTQSPPHYRTALQNAASIASLLLTTDAAIAELKEK